jgi:hypothetical protein
MAVVGKRKMKVVTEVWTTVPESGPVVIDTQICLRNVKK